MLTERQKAFVAAYSGPGSGLAAARAAGYSGNDATLRVAASKLLRVPAVAAALEDRVPAPGPALVPTVAPARGRAPKRDRAIADSAEQQRILTRLARDPELDAETRIKAVVALTRVQSAPAPRPPLPALVPPRTGATVHALFRVTHDQVEPLDATPRRELARG